MKEYWEPDLGTEPPAQKELAVDSELKAVHHRRPTLADAEGDYPGVSIF
jgi:hypothetical protein